MERCGETRVYKQCKALWPVPQLCHGGRLCWTLVESVNQNPRQRGEAIPRDPGKSGNAWFFVRKPVQGHVLNS